MTAARRLAACLAAIFLVAPHAGAFSLQTFRAGKPCRGLAPCQRVPLHHLKAGQRPSQHIRSSSAHSSEAGRSPCTLHAADEPSVSIPASATGRTLTLEREDDIDALSWALSEKLEQLEGIWYSDDFYGPHGREWVVVSATLVGAGTSSLVAVKVKGDANVPSGFETWRTRGLPDVGGINVCMYVCVYSCTYAFMFLHMYVCMYVCMYIRIYLIGITVHMGTLCEVKKYFYFFPHVFKWRRTN